jgi:hypothetical protein
MRNIIIEMTPIDPATGLSTTIRMSANHAGANGTILDGKVWTPAITAGPNFAASIWDQGQPTPLSISYGKIAFTTSGTLANIDWARLSFNGTQATVWTGALGDPFISYRKLWTGALGPFERTSDTTATVDLLGPEAILDRNLLSASYLGTGNAEGPASMLGVLKPYAIGAATNVAPVLIDPVYWIYQVDAYDACTINAVYSNALALLPEKMKGNVATYAALKAMTLVPGEWATASAVGMFRLGADPQGAKITADIGSTATVGAIVTSLLNSAGLSASRIDASVATATRGYSLYATSQVTIIEAIRAAAFAGGKYLVADSSAKFYLADAISTKTPGTLTSNRSSYPLVLPDSIKAPVPAEPTWRVKVGHTRVWSTHSTSEISPAIAELGDNILALQADAETRAEQADATEADATYVRQRIESIDDDLKLDRSEKLELVRRFQNYTAERAGVLSTVNGLGQTAIATDYTTKYDNFKNYLLGLTPAYDDTDTDTPITGDLIAYENAYLVARQNATNAAANAAAKVANWTGVESRPENLTALDPAAGGKLDGVENEATKGAPAGTDVAGVPASTVAASIGTLTNAGFLDTTAPAIPSALSLSSTITDQGATLTATWAASTATDIAGYTFAIKEGSGSYIEYSTTAPIYQLIALKRNQAYTVKVAASDKAGNRSAFSAEQTITTARDTVAPAAPTAFAVESSQTLIFLTWTNPVANDLLGVAIYRSATNDPATAVLFDTVNAISGASGTHTSNLQATSTYYFWLKAYDTSGNYSGFSAGVSIARKFVDLADFTPGLTPPKTVATLPAAAGYTGTPLVYLQSDGKLYRYFNGAWTSAVGSADISAIPSTATVTNVVGANTLADAFTRAAFATVTGVPANVQSLVGTEALKNADITVNSSGQLVGIGTTGKTVDNTQIAITNGTLTGIGTGTGTAISNALINVTNGVLGGIGTGNNTAVSNSLITLTNGLITGIGTGANTAVGNTLINVDTNGKLQGIGTGVGAVVDNTKVVVGGTNSVKKADWSGASYFTSTAMPNGKSGWGFTINKGTSNVVVQSVSKSFPKGQEITFSFIAWIAVGTGTCTMNVDLYPDTLPETVFNLTTTPTKYAWTSSSSAADMANATTRFFLVDATSNNDTICITDIQWEIGNKATDWSPNPFDPDSLRQAGFSGDLASTRGAPAGTTINDVAVEVITAAINAATSDNIISIGEKPAIYTEWQRILKEENSLYLRATEYVSAGKGTRYGVQTKRDELVTAKDALSAYMNAVGMANFGADSAVDGANVRTLFANVYAKIEPFKMALQYLASESADWGLTTGTGRPADNATVGAPAGTNVGDTAAATIETRANDPATRINQNTVTVDGGKLTAGTVTAREVAASSITTNKLLIGDTTNFAENADFGLGNVGWLLQRNSGVTATITASTEAYQGGWIGAVTGLGGGGFRNNGWMRVSPGDQLMGVIVAKGGAGSIYPRISFLNAAGTEVSVTSGTSIVANGSYQRVVVNGVVPSNAVFARIEAFYDVQTSGFVYLGFAGLYRRATGELIVDGSITTNKMIANTINADRLLINTITGDKIVANAIAANQLTVQSRQVSTIGLNMRINVDNSTMSWDDGQVRFVNNDGTMGYYPVTGSPSVPYQNAHMYFFYVPGRPVIDYNTDSANLGLNDRAMIAVWKGGTDLTVMAGVGTLVNGDRIVTGSIDANRIKANTIISNLVQVQNATDKGNLGDAILRANDPAARINAVGTTIDGGKITTGSIQALQIASNTIAANKFVAATRPFSAIGLNMRIETDGKCYWDTCPVYYQKGDGTLVTNRTIAGGSAVSNGVVRFYYYLGDDGANTNLDVRYSNALDLETNGLYKLVATWKGGTDLTVAAGVGTIVNGDRIVTGTLNANKITANTFTGNQIVAGSIQTAQLAAGAITASKLAIGNSDNIIPDGDFRDINFWVGANPDAGMSVSDQNGAWNWRRKLYLSGNFDRYSSFFPVEPGATYKIKVGIYVGNMNAGGWLNAVIHMPGVQYFSLKTGLGMGNPGVADAPYGFTGNYDNRSQEFIYTNPTGVADNANRQWQFRFTSGNFSGYAEIMVSITRVSDNTLIQDGAITTNKITVNSLNADRILAGSIMGDKISTTTSLPGSITIGQTGVQIETVRDAAVNSGNATWYEGTGAYLGQYTFAGNKVSKIQPNAWTANAYTREIYVGGCFINGRMTSDETFFGLASNRSWNNNNDYSLIDYAFHRSSDGNYYAWENGVSVQNFGNAVSAGIQYVNCSIVYDGKTVRYYANGTLKREVATTENRALSGAVCVGYGAKYVDALSFGAGADNSLSRTDPAARINANSTNITPGRIQIQGGTTLNDWKNGNDSTEIRGGAIAANTINANKLTIGNRGIAFIGLNFEWRPAENRVYWDNGYIYYTDNFGTRITQNINGGNTGSLNSHRWFVWRPGRDYIEATQVDPGTDDQIVLGAWWGGNNLNITYGGTIVNGGKISTNTITADKMNVATLSAITANIGSITAGVIRSPNDATFMDMGAGYFRFGATEFNIHVPGVAVVQPFQYANGVLNMRNVAIDGGSISNVTISTSKIIGNAVTTNAYATIDNGGTMGGFPQNQWVDFNTTSYGGGGSDGGGGGGSGGGGGACPVLNTPILLANSERNGSGETVMAGDLRVGDYVWTQHEKTMEWGAFSVTYAKVVADVVVHEVTIDGNKLVASWDHPVWVDSRWATMAELSEVCGRADVMRITIDDAHTYISNGILSHNKIVNQQQV